MNLKSNKTKPFSHVLISLTLLLAISYIITQPSLKTFQILLPMYFQSPSIYPQVADQLYTAFYSFINVNNEHNYQFYQQLVANPTNFRIIKRYTYHIFDSSNNGYINIKEWKSFTNLFYLAKEQFNFDALHMAFDKNNDQRITYEEWDLLFTKAIRPKLLDLLWKLHDNEQITMKGDRVQFLLEDGKNIRNLQDPTFQNVIDMFSNLLISYFKDNQSEEDILLYTQQIRRAGVWLLLRTERFAQFWEMIFQLLDSNGDSYVKISEVEKWKQIGDSSLDSIFKLDDNEDSQISRQEWESYGETVRLILYNSFGHQYYEFEKV